MKVALLSCGLGKVQRGFEVSTARWQQALAKHSNLDLKLYAGGKFQDTEYVWTIARDDLLNSPLKIFCFEANKKSFWEFCYGIEMISFAISVLPLLLKYRPDVIWTKEVVLPHFLVPARILFNLKYKIIFANGGAFRPNTYKDFDFIQHLHPEGFREAANFGIPEEKMFTLTNCIPFHKPHESKAELRKHFGFAGDDFVVISVAAWNSYHKRIDFLIEEVARIEDPRVKLLLVGHPDSGTDKIKQMAAAKLKDRVHWLTLPEQDVHRALTMADLFILASVEEGLGNAMAEASMAPLPVICHSTQASRFIYNEDPFWMRDISQPGSIAERILELKSNPVPIDKLESIRDQVGSRFSPEALVPQFLEMLKRIESLKQPPSKVQSKSKNEMAKAQ